MVGMSLSVGVFLVVCFSRTLYHRLRATVRPWAIRKVEQGRWIVIWVQKFHHPWLDTLHMICSHTCGVNFYIR